MLYEDAAAQARIVGVVFLDDAYLDDTEDFHPDALEEYKKIAGNGDVLYKDLDEETQKIWIARKTQALNDLIDACIDGVKRYRPLAKTARTLYAPVLLSPESEEWFAQDYAESLRRYDYVVVMAYPEMEKVPRPMAWLKRLVKKVKAFPDGLAKTVFKIQAYDWERKRWIKDKVLLARLRALVADGAWHIGYYPDDCFGDKPQQETIRLMIGSEDFPFKRGEVPAEMDPYR
jgi:biofilm PGA synthesis lipoprotein PgaB